MGKMLQSTYRRPSPALRKLICGYFIIAGDGQDDPGHVCGLLPSNAMLFIERHGQSASRARGGEHERVVLVGPTTRPMQIGTNGPFRQVGVELKPQGWRAFVDSNISDFIDRKMDVLSCPNVRRRSMVSRINDSETDDEAVTELNAMFEHLLEDPYLEHSDLLDAFEEYFQEAEGSALAADAMAAHFGISTRHLARLCHNFYGFPSKTVLRRWRFMRAVGGFPGSPRDARAWQDAIGDDFCDQSHFIREFKRFAGTTPTRFLSQNSLAGLYSMRERIAVGMRSIAA
jgi:AraC-like DNA-binding protein